MTALLSETTARAIATAVGLAVFGGGAAMLLAVVYRWYAGRRIPPGLSLLAGLGVVALSINTTAALGDVIGGSDGLLAIDVAVRNVLTFIAAGVLAVGGGRFGDRLTRVVSVASGARELDAEVSRVVTAVGRVIAVELPDDIEDLSGYDPVSADTKAAITGKTLLFPRRLTVAELRDRLVTRLKEDYGVGHVSLDLADDGTITHLAVGSREAGIGPTLAPGTAATAIRADPPFSARSGDLVQVWQGGTTPTRVTTAEFRASQNDIVTLALEEADAETLDPAERYRLVTLPAERRADREFAGLLRAADETFDVVTLEAGSPLVGVPVGALELTVVAIRAAGGGVDAIPPRSRVLADADTVYVVASPTALRRLDAAAAALD